MGSDAGLTPEQLLAQQIALHTAVLDPMGMSAQLVLGGGSAAQSDWTVCGADLQQWYTGLSAVLRGALEPVDALHCARRFLQLMPPYAHTAHLQQVRSIHTHNTFACTYARTYQHTSRCITRTNTSVSRKANFSVLLLQLLEKLLRQYDAELAQHLAPRINLNVILHRWFVAFFACLLPSRVVERYIYEHTYTCACKVCGMCVVCAHVWCVCVCVMFVLVH